MTNFPTEIITEILSRLPVKSLLKFRSVSKFWLALISSPEFVKTHLSISAKNKRVVLTEIKDLFSSRETQYILREFSLSSLRNNDYVIEAFDLDYPMNNPQQNVRVVGSVNGLICLAMKENDLVLWNPSIRKFKKLPDSRLRVSGGSYFYCPTSFVFGFGYDEFSDDYKVVRVLCVNGKPILDHIKGEIYSLKSNSWSTTGDVPDVVRLIEPCKFVHGKLHWAGELSCANIFRRFHKDWNITCIDLADEKWGKVEQPRFGGGGFSLKLEVLESDLSVFCSYIESHADVWVMREYGIKESWTKMYTIKYPGLCSSFIPQTLCMSNKGDILLVPGSTLMVHNLEDEPIRYPKVTNFGSCVAVNTCIESLVCAPLLGTNKAQNKNEGCKSSGGES